jgi:hypothetical protein
MPELPGPPLLDDDPLPDPLTPSWAEPASDPALLGHDLPLALSSPLRLVPKRATRDAPAAHPVVPAASSLRSTSELLDSKVSPEDSPTFAARVVDLPPISWLAAELVPTEGIFLFHGRPRSMKSLNLLALAFDLAHGRAVFGAPRFAVSRPCRVLYLSEEDPERLIFERLARIQRGAELGLTSNLRFLLRRGISLDSEHDRAALSMMIAREGFDVAIFEPMRSLTSSAEATAAEFKPIGDWIRHLQASTSCKAIGMGAHWRKPSKSQAGGRSESLSGAALFSFSDCLISVQKVSWNEAVLVPEDYKLGADPPAFLVRWNTEAGTSPSGRPTFGEWILPEIVEVTSPEDAVRAQLVLQVVSWLADNPWRTAPEVAAGCKLSKHSPSEPDSVYSLLGYLQSQGTIQVASKDQAKMLGRSVRAKLYAVAGAEVVPAPPSTPTTPERGQL